MTDERFAVVASRRLGRGSLITLDEVRVRVEGGGEVLRDVVRHPGGVAVLPVEGEEVWLVRQYRVALGRWVTEIPAGVLDHPGEAPEAAAHRELAEELGARAGRLEHLATIAPSPGYTEETLTVFAATDLEFGSRRPDGAEEDHAEILRLPVAVALDSIDAGELIDAKTVVALLQWKRRRG